jgi:hypothetical protein
MPLTNKSPFPFSKFNRFGMNGRDFDIGRTFGLTFGSTKPR